MCRCEASGVQINVSSIRVGASVSESARGGPAELRRAGGVRYPPTRGHDLTLNWVGLNTVFSSLTRLIIRVHTTRGLRHEDGVEQR